MHVSSAAACSKPGTANVAKVLRKNYSTPVDMDDMKDEDSLYTRWEGRRSDG